MLSPADVFLVIPPGLDRAIFPWGVTSLAESLNHDGHANAQVWALNDEPWLTDIAERYAEPLTEVVRCLTRAARGVFVGHTSSALLFLGLVGHLGARFIDVAKEEGLLRLPLREKKRAELAAALDEVRAHVDEHMRAGIVGCIGLATSKRRVWGISVYDYTLFNALALAAMIRELDPSGTIVLGGDYFDYGSAGTTLRAAADIDAIVVGYGEEVLRTIAATVARGEMLDSVTTTGLVTRAALASGERAATMASADRALGLGKTTREEREASVSVPRSYRQPSDNPPVEYVQVQDSGKVRVLTQRGCSWGKCTFCSQLDRRMYFSLGPDALVKQLTASIADTPEDALREISLDADENDLNAVLPLLDVVQRSPGRYHVEFWLMVRKFGVELPRFLTSQKRNMALTVILNIESLSQTTLKRMKKGVVPLAILEAVKAIQDTGHTVRTNYFLNFPGEDLASVREEADILERVKHLFTSERMEPSIFTYMANTRDEVHWESEKFRILARRIPEDVWLRRGFGVDLPFSIWSMKNGRVLPAVEPAHLVPYAFHHKIFAERRALSSRTSQSLFGRGGRGALIDRAAAVLERAELAAWSLALDLTQRLARDDSYARRQAVVDHVDGVFDGTQPRTTLLIDGTTLVKGRVRMPLDARDLELLRFLYWSRKRGDVGKRFRAWGEPALETLLSRHTELGTILGDGRSLLAIVHDPGYWQTEASRHDGPSALTDLEPRLPELAQLRPRTRARAGAPVGP